MKRVLVTGAEGLLGTELARACGRAGLEVVALGHEALDVTDAGAAAEALGRHRPDVVLHCAGYTAVDRAEAEPDAAREVNVAGVRRTAEAARDVGARMVSFSTDFVFDGTKRSPYLPGDPPAPLGAYGRSKLEGEVAQSESGVDGLIVRTSWLYGEAGPNFVTAILRRAEAGEPLRVVSDQRGRPTWARNLAGITLELLGRDVRGIWHAADGDECTWLELAEEAMRVRGIDGKIRGVSTEEWGAAAERPRYSVLDVSATEELLGRPMMPWREALRRFLHVRGDG